MFKAIYLTKNNDGLTEGRVENLEESALPEFDVGGVLVKVDYSTINYKDGLAITGKSPVVRKFPMVPGIDLSGTVVESNHANWVKGDQVILNGWGVGESHWGGLAQLARVSGDWLIKKPANLTSRDAMSIGTAGYTAMLCVMALQKHEITPNSGEILVTGASGGVGSFAVAILAGLGYAVVASTGKLNEKEYLMGLGAKEVIDRKLLSDQGKPLQKERWAGVIDTVGSTTLANACASTKYGGVVTACGLAQGMDLPLTVAPSILRAVKLIGIDSVMANKKLREDAWKNLSEMSVLPKINQIVKTASLEKAIDVAHEILSGSVRGRVLVDVNQW